MSRNAIVIPILPADDIRAAADIGDWTRAAALIAGHDHAVRSAWIDPPRDNDRLGDDGIDAGWRQLLAQQEALLLELQQRRDAAGEAAARMQREGRAAQRYLAEAADVE